MNRSLCTSIDPMRILRWLNPLVTDRNKDGSQDTDTRDDLERQANYLPELRLRAGDLQRAPLPVQAQSLRQSLSTPQAVRELVLKALSAQ